VPSRTTNYAGLIRIARITAVIVVPLVDYRMSSGSLLSLCYVPLLLLASPAFVCISYGLTPMFLLYLRPDGAGFEPFLAYYPLYITAHEVFTFLQFGLALSFALDGNLWAEVQPASLRARVYERHGRIIRAVLIAVCITLILALLLESTSLVHGAAWALLLLYLRRGVPEPPPRPRASRRERMGTIGLAVVSIGLALTLFELGAQLIPEENEASEELFEPHTGAIFTLSPGSRTRRMVPVAADRLEEVEYVISSQGIRDRQYGCKEPDEFRILMLGDSFMFGYATSLEDSIPRQLEGLLAEQRRGKRIRVVNAGVPGYGPYQERIFLEQRGFPLEPDLVILQIFPANDLDNTLGKVGRRLRAYNREWHLVVQRERFRNVWQVRSNRFLGRKSKAYRVIENLTDTAPMLVHGWNRVRFLPPCAYQELPPNEKRPFVIETDLAEWYPDIELAVDMLVEDVLGIRADCEARSVDFAAFCVPSHQTADDAVWGHVMDKRPAGVNYERGKALRIVQKRLTVEGVALIDLPRCLRAVPDIGDSYYQFDGHFTPKGCAEVAACLADYLLDHYLPDTVLLDHRVEPGTQ